MFRNAVAFLFVLFFCGQVEAQSLDGLLGEIRKIKLLESTRDDVRKILANYNTNEDNEHHQRYYNEDVNIRILYSDGTCSDDPEDDDDSVIWKVSEWTVTRIEIDLEQDMAANDLGFKLSKFMKEQIDRNSPSLHIYHDKAAGVAVETQEDDVGEIIFFPSKSQSRQLCEGSKVAKEFYARKSWFDKELAKRVACDWKNIPADVHEMVLSASEVEASTGKTISVETTAIDPENDVLTYSYRVSAGRVIGMGAKVTWDLTGVKAGTYTITVGVDDGMGIVGKTVTKSVTVK